MANTAAYSNWSPYENYVQSGGAGPGMVDGKFLSGAYVGIFAGPPRLSAIGGALSLGAAIDTPATANQLVYPVGVTQNFSLGQNQQLARVFELGSQRSYFIPGRTVGQVALSRVMYHGPSLLRTLYAYYNDAIPPALVPEMFPNVGASAMPNPHDVILPPGYENLYLNLASDLFTQSVGLLCVLRDSNNDTYGSFYLEDCRVPNHNFGVDSGNVLMQESVGIQYEQLVPIAARSIELVT